MRDSSYTHLDADLRYRLTFQQSNSPTTRPASASTTPYKPVEESLGVAANIVLFTPVIIPAGEGKKIRETDMSDPFEALGRALHTHHRRIRHVPYVPAVGFTETHSAFVSQADAVITVVCEPENMRDGMGDDQMEFAEDALDAMDGKEANAGDALILVQCGSDQFLPRPSTDFVNVLEVPTYSADVAAQLAQSIFKIKPRAA